MSEIFHTHIDWTGAAKGAAAVPAGFSRDLSLTAAGHVLPLSSAPSFQGDPARANPEQLFVGALSACQALTYLALAARKQLPVVAYEDDAEGVLEKVEGRTRMSRVVLRPRITLEGIADDGAAGEMLATAHALVGRAHAACFIANSVTVEVTLAPSIAFHER